MIELKNKRAQVWVETVIYTLIFLTIIAGVLAFVTPAIYKQRDKSAVQQSIGIMNNIDSMVSEIKFYQGNSRPLQLMISRGQLTIDGENDLVSFTVDDSAFPYGEPGQNITQENMVISTIPRGNNFNIVMVINYSQSNLNITYNGADTKHIFSASPTAYNIVVKNTGKSIDFF